MPIKHLRARAIKAFRRRGVRARADKCHPSIYVHLPTHLPTKHLGGSTPVHAPERANQAFTRTCQPNIASVGLAKCQRR